MAWPSAPLREVIAIHYGKSLSAKVRRAGTVPVFGSNGVVGYHDEPLVHHATIVIGRKGSVGELNFCEVPSFPIDTTFYVEVMDASRVSLKYLYRAMKSINLKRHIIAVGVPGINREDIYKEEIPLPPLAEQQRIVEILDRAAAIQRLRRAAEEKAREIIPALFVDMFGDPVTNPKGWPMRKLEDVATVDRGRSRHRPRDDKALYNGSYPFIQTSEVANSGGLITQYTTTYSEFGLAQSKLWPSGTLCVTIAANIAKTGILQFAACFPDSVVAVIPGSTTNNEFLQAWLAFLQPTLEAQAPQLAQKNINLEILRALAVPMPPKSLQDKFSELCQRVRAMQALNDNSATVAISTNQSLASTLFSAA
jgi:type I restriction enzyme S subunit